MGEKIARSAEAFLEEAGQNERIGNYKWEFNLIKDSPAERAGLKRGDVVVRLNGTEMKDAHTLSRHVAGTAPDTEVTMDIIRDRKEKAVKVRIGTMAQEQEEPTPQSDPST